MTATAPLAGTRVIVAADNLYVEVDATGEVLAVHTRADLHAELWRRHLQWCDLHPDCIAEAGTDPDTLLARVDRDGASGQLHRWGYAAAELPIAGRRLARGLLPIYAQTLAQRGADAAAMYLHDHEETGR